jgi:hypothetical protein
MNGVYEDMRPGISGSREDFLRMRLKEAFEDYSAIFPEFTDPGDLARYLEKHSPKMRELLLEVDNFVGIVCNKLDAIPEYLRDAIALVMMFSILETLQLATKKYVELSHWLQTEESARRVDELAKRGLGTRQVLRTLMKDYFSTYGSTHAATDFFENLLSKTEKKQLIQNYRTKKECLEGVWNDTLQMMLPSFNGAMTIAEISKALGDRVKVGEEFLPVCYCTACYIDYGDCDPSFGCRLDDEAVLRTNLNKVTKRLVYAYRNAFVHKSRLPIIPEAGSSNRNVFHVFDVLEDRIVLHTLDMKFLLNIFRNAFRKFFETTPQTAMK